MIFDTFPYNGEADIIECRIRELESVPDLVHVVVEADVDHQDHPKPYYWDEHASRFDQWAERIVHVKATGLPTHEQDPDPWAREIAQREYAWEALRDAKPDDVVLHGDVDEIPTALVTRTLALPTWRGFKACKQRLYCFAVDWYHPGYWRGTVAGHVRDVGEFGDMRSIRGFAELLPNAGWHLSWLGGKEAALKKLGSFCHPEIADRTLEGLLKDEFLIEGRHVDGQKLIAVDVDKTWPKWVYERKCPESWFRPR